VIILVAAVALVINEAAVDGLHRLAGRTANSSPARVSEVPFPLEIERDLNVTLEGLEDAGVVVREESEAIRSVLPSQVDYEFGNQAPYGNPFDFAVFDRRDKSGGLLVVGDSSVSFGLSLDHIALGFEEEVHSVAFGFNTLDATLLSAIDRIVRCYYEAPPIVLVSHATYVLKSERLRRGQDLAIRHVAEAGDCEALDALVGQRRTRAGDGEGKAWPSPFDFAAYRAFVKAAVESPIELRHVAIHELIEPARFDLVDMEAEWQFVRWAPEFRVPYRPEFDYRMWRPVAARFEQEALRSDEKSRKLAERGNSSRGNGVSDCGARHVLRAGPGVGPFPWSRERVEEAVEERISAHGVAFKNSGGISSYCRYWEEVWTHVAFHVRNFSALSRTIEALRRDKMARSLRLSQVESEYRVWEGTHGACLVIPLSTKPIALVRRELFGSQATCVLDFNAIAKDVELEGRIQMQSAFHYASAGGVVFGYLLGRELKSLELPRWRSIASD
jgi:hypothetical protein